MTELRKIGERGQVTIPKQIRDSEGLKGGDKVSFEKKNDKIVIEKEDKIEERLKEGYQSMSQKSKEISEEMLKASTGSEELID